MEEKIQVAAREDIVPYLPITGYSTVYIYYCIIKPDMGGRDGRHFYKKKTEKCELAQLLLARPFLFVCF